MKYIEVKYRIGDNGNAYATIVKQTHRAAYFGRDGSQEFSSPELDTWLASYECPEPELNPSGKLYGFYCHGNAYSYDDNEVCIGNVENIFRLNQAIAAYNHTFKDA